MTNYRKFEKAAQGRKTSAFWIAVSLHLVLLAALFYGKEIGALMSGFFQDLLSSPSVQPRA